ncbi:MAG: hypothetical protein HYU81_01345 [Candidatus Brennerbacteria bacterium]|nr:hypothetical protein [Candidatus Brennerbacteria bacterium]
MTSEDRSKNKEIFLIALAAILAGGIFYTARSNPVLAPAPVFCTQEVKQCPDGSYVGRSGPQCEFTACLGENADAAWKSFTDDKQGITFSYPTTLTTQYTVPIDWPPKAAALVQSFICTPTGDEYSQAGRTVQRMVDDRTYCVTMESNMGLGSVITQYVYATEKNDKLVIFTFSLQAVRCDHYDEPQRTACENERSSFDLDGVVDRMAQSVVLR